MSAIVKEPTKEQLKTQVQWCEIEIARLRDEVKAAIADKLIANMRVVKLEAALEEIANSDPAKTWPETFIQIARKALAKEGK